MTDYDNSNRLSLWKNDRREKQEQPHLSGQGETDKEVWVSAWFAKDLDPKDAQELSNILKRHKETSNKPFISVSMKVKDSPAHNGTTKCDTATDNDIPF